MDYAKSYTTCINGLDTAKIIVEAHISNGIPAFNIVGLGDGRQLVRQKSGLGHIIFYL